MTNEPNVKVAAVITTFGVDLTPADYEGLDARWITRELADEAMLRRVDTGTGRQIVGRKVGDFAGLLIPYTIPGNGHAREYRIRRDHPDLESDNGKRKERAKYVGPPGRGNLMYFPPGVSAQLLARADVPVVITEGEFKALSLWRLATYRVDAPRFLPVGLAGVWNFRGTVGKTNGAGGERRDVKGVIADFDRITWQGRRVIVAYDADASNKEGVRIARATLTRELRRRGATVANLEWDATLGKGIDDHLATAGPEKVLDEIAALNFDRSDWRANLIKNQQGDPRALLANCITALREAPEWAGVLGFNDFSLGTVALLSPPWTGAAPGSEWTDHEDRLAADWLQRKGIYVSVEVAGQAVQTVAKDRRFHPVREYLDLLNWDGTNRIDTWLSLYLGVEPSEYAAAVGARWLIQAVARIYRPAAKADCCLILEGAQGSLKSTALKILADPWFTDEIAELGTKDASMQTRGVWLIELAELDSMTRGEVSKIKAFMSRSTDRFRPPYGKRLIESPRQCVFAGSVNHSTYLRDDTGGRRFWPVACGSIDTDNLARDRDQLWAESLARFRGGAVWWLDSVDLNRQAEQEQAARFEGGPWDGLIARWVADRDTVSIEDVLLFCIEKSKAIWTQADKNAVARCLRVLGWERYQIRTGSGREWRYRSCKL